MFTCEVFSQPQQRSAMVVCDGNLDLEATDWFEDRLPFMLGPPDKVSFDLGSVDTINSDGAALLSILIHDLQRQDKTVKLLNVLPVPMIVLIVFRFPLTFGFELFEN